VSSATPYGRLPVQVDPARDGYRLPPLPKLRGDVEVKRVGLRWKDREAGR